MLLTAATKRRVGNYCDGEKQYGNSEIENIHIRYMLASIASKHKTNARQLFGGMLEMGVGERKAE